GRSVAGMSVASSAPRVIEAGRPGCASWAAASCANRRAQAIVRGGRRSMNGNSAVGLGWSADRTRSERSIVAELRGSRETRPVLHADGLAGARYLVAHADHRGAPPRVPAAAELPELPAQGRAALPRAQ